MYLQSKSSDLTKNNIDLRENMKSLRNKMKCMEAQNNRIETMLNAIMLHHDIKIPNEPSSLGNIARKHIPF